MSDLDVGGPRGDLTHHSGLAECEAGILLRLDEVLLKCLLQQLDSEATWVLQVTEVADLLELVGRRHRRPLLEDPLPGEVHISNTDSNFPVATGLRTVVLLAPRSGLLDMISYQKKSRLSSLKNCLLSPSRFHSTPKKSQKTLLTF